MRKNLGHRISQYREKKGLTQSALASRLGVDKGTVWRWEGGRSWPDNLEPIATALGVEVEDLFGEVSAAVVVPKEEILKAAKEAVTLASRLGPSLVARLSALKEDQLSEFAAIAGPVIDELLAAPDSSGASKDKKSG